MINSFLEKFRVALDHSLRRWRMVKIECIIIGVGMAVACGVFLLVWHTRGLEGLTWGGNDFVEYDTLARNVLGGHGFSVRSSPPYEPSGVRTPGYPLFLAFSHALSGGTIVASLLQIALFGGFGILGYRILLLLGLARRYAFYGALLTVFEPDVLSMGLYLISDMLFNFLLLLSLYFYLRFLREDSGRWFLWGSSLAGPLTLVRPVGMVLFIVFTVVFLIRKGIRRELVLSILMVAAFLFPWSARNYAAFGTWRLSSADTYNRYAVVASQVIALRDGTSYGAARESLLERFLGAADPADLKSLGNVGYLYDDYDRAEFLLADTFRYDQWMKRQIKEIVRSSPISYAKAVFLGTAEYFNQVNWLTPLEHWDILHPSYRPQKSVQQIFFEDGVSALLGELRVRFSCGISCVFAFGLNAAGRVLWLFVVPLALVGAAALFRVSRSRFLLISVFSFMIAFAALHIFFTAALVQPRYRMPLVPFFFGFAFYGAMVLWGYLKPWFLFRKA